MKFLGFLPPPHLTRTPGADFFLPPPTLEQKDSEKPTWIGNLGLKLRSDFLWSHSLGNMRAGEERNWWDRRGRIRGLQRDQGQGSPKTRAREWKERDSVLRSPDAPSSVTIFWGQRTGQHPDTWKPLWTQGVDSATLWVECNRKTSTSD